MGQTSLQWLLCEYNLFCPHFNYYIYSMSALLEKNENEIHGDIRLKGNKHSKQQ